MTDKRDFEAVAATWDENPGRVKVARAVVEATQAAVSLRPDMKLLDYGCGTGLVTLGLHPEVGETVAADSSAGMLAALREKIAAAGLTDIRPLQLDLQIEDMPEGDFDVIVSSMTFHHLADPEGVARKLAGALKPEGMMAVTDLGAGSENFHPDNTGVFHFGFGPEAMQAIFAVAGLGDLRTVEAVRMTRETGEFVVLLTVGTKAS